MGIKKFFKKVGSGIKKAASWTKDKFHKTVNVVKKFSKPVMGIVDKVSGLLANVPGKIGMIAGGVNAANGLANKVMDQIPDGAAKDKLKAAQGKTTNTANNILTKVGGVVDTANNYIQRGQNIANLIKTNI